MKRVQVAPPGTLNALVTSLNPSGTLVHSFPLKRTVVHWPLKSTSLQKETSFLYE